MRWKFFSEENAGDDFECNTCFESCFQMTVESNDAIALVLVLIYFLIGSKIW